jgi:hypothetical protein
MRRPAWFAAMALTALGLALAIPPPGRGTGTMGFQYGPALDQWSNDLGDYLNDSGVMSGCELHNERDIPTRICAYTTPAGEAIRPPLAIPDTVVIHCSACIQSHTMAFISLPDVNCSNVLTIRAFPCGSDTTSASEPNWRLCESEYKVPCGD